MEVRTNGMPKKIADFLKEIENRPMYLNPTAYTHRMPSISPYVYSHRMPSISPDIYCHSVLTPNSNEQGKTYMGQCREHLNRAFELGFDPTIGFPAPPGWKPDKVDKDPER